MKKILSVILAFTLMLTLSACSASGSKNGATDTPSASGSFEPSGKGHDTYLAMKEEAGDYAEGAIDGYAPAEDRLEAFSPAEGVADADFSLSASGAEMPSGASGNGAETPSAGTLTAGEWKDLEDLAFWKKLLLENDWYKLMEDRGIFADKVSVVSVKDKNGSPCFNASVALLDGSGNTICEAVSDITGHAYLTYAPTGTAVTPEKVRVAEIEVPFSEGVISVTLDGGHRDITALDLMLTFDTTGSMADELEYLKVELEDVVKRVSQSSNGILSINISVNFYRDTTDDYIVRPFEFTSELSDAMSALKAQNAAGGGDYPEAVHAALESSVYEHQWREGAIKLMFLVLDAPPHNTPEINAQILDTLTDAAKMGIRMIPIASSGVNTETEFLIRSYAVMTGGTYIFLTDDSGVGGSHLEPTVGEYQVEALSDCLVRVIKEYCGLK